MFTESAPRLIQSKSYNVRMLFVVCCLSPPGNHDSRWTGQPWSNDVSLILANKKMYFSRWVLTILVLHFLKSLRSLQSILMCIVRELGGGGFVAVAVGVSDR